MNCFGCGLKVHTVWILIYLPFLPFFLLHPPTFSSWWRTCWSGACALLSIFDAQDWIYDVRLCTLMSICSVSRNIRNPYVKGLHSHALGWLVLMYLASILKELYTRFVWGNFYEFDDDWKEIYDVCLCNVIPIFSVKLNIPNPCVKGLHSHELEWLVFMYLDSTLRELYIRFVWRNLYDV